jgi:hypothetical protein
MGLLGQVDTQEVEACATSLDESPGGAFHRLPVGAPAGVPDINVPAFPKDAACAPPDSATGNVSAFTGADRRFRAMARAVAVRHLRNRAWPSPRPAHVVVVHARKRPL